MTSVSRNCHLAACLYGTTYFAIVGDNGKLQLAETLDKFEEDVLKCYSATVRGERQSTISFGEPIEVEYTRDRSASAELTSRLEERVQQLLDEIT